MWFMMRALFLACRQLCPHLVERVRALVSLLIKVLMPSWGSTLITSFKSNYLAKAPPPNTFPLMRFQLVHFGGHKHSVYNTHTFTRRLLRSTVCSALGIYRWKTCFFSGSFQMSSWEPWVQHHLTWPNLWVSWAQLGDRVEGIVMPLVPRSAGQET